MKTLLNIMALTLAVFAAGCADLNGAKPDGKNDTGKVEAASTATEAFKKPNPGSVADDPRMIQAKNATDTVTRSLTLIRERLTSLRKSYDDKVATEKDLKSIVQRLLPLSRAAREDCDTIKRAVIDLRLEMHYAQSGYRSAAALYRERAQSYSDPEPRAITLTMAEEFDRLAADVPRRRIVLNEFNWKLSETGEFLADTERCLRETEVALTILTAGPDPVTISAQSKAFRKQLEEFIAVLEEYQQKLLGRPVGEGAKNPPKDGKNTTPETKPHTAPPPSVPKADPTPAPPKVIVLPPGKRIAPVGSPVFGTPPPSELERTKR